MKMKMQMELFQKSIEKPRASSFEDRVAEARRFAKENGYQIVYVERESGNTVEVLAFPFEDRYQRDVIIQREMRRAGDDGVEARIA